MLIEIILLLLCGISSTCRLTLRWQIHIITMISLVEHWPYCTFLGMECWPVVIQWENSAALPCTAGLGSMVVTEVGTAC